MSSQYDYAKMYKQFKTENFELKQTIEQQGQTIEQQGQTIKELNRLTVDLKLRLGQHDNYNTQSSQQKGSKMYSTKKKEEEEEKKKKSGTSSKIRKGQKGHGDESDGQKLRGDQKGHKGKTCKRKPIEQEDHMPDSCPECGSGSLSITKTLKHNITKALHTIKVITTSHSINTCRCRSCGRDGIEQEAGIPNNGSYDSSITTEVTDDYACRMPFRMIADRMTRHVISLSSGTVHNIMRRLGVSLRTPTADIAAAIRKARILHSIRTKDSDKFSKKLLPVVEKTVRIFNQITMHIDETSIHLNGRIVWVRYCMILHTGYALYVIQDSRGADVLRKTLGDWDGVIVCDGWSAYNGYRVQRFWSHIIREARDFHERNPNNAAAYDVLRRLRKIYDDAKKVSKKRSRSLRHRAYANLIAHINRIVARYSDDPLLEKFIGKINNAGSDLFRFVLNPNIPPTNNAAERGLREIVVHRKVRGGIRAEETMTWMANFFSCIMTWKNKGLDHIAELAKYA